ncbi:hypothetical protein KGF57_003486 [Candida theae]|uniref:alpha-galactosidase n=1 Tax=Candida theae TaxID=1198502 RepID=A0AAD5FXZ6_9ASCO|nr:uncharacterized protein KGF57_003486 [Candida theae]KAI5956000.1 hypothetical protein KGF57_003486 [Candida theae]
MGNRTQYFNCGSRSDPWDYILDNPPTKINKHTKVYDIDLFDSSTQLINNLHSQSKVVICYFSAGTYEDWRPDAANFSQADLGNNLHDWKGERWINITSPRVLEIMKSRISLANSKGCDAVDPDNIDAYDNKSGLNLTQSDSIAYIKKLSDIAKKYDLAIGLKNGGGIVEAVLPYVDFAVQEQCGQYKECKKYQPFIHAKKLVFHVEYPPKVKSKLKTRFESKRSKFHWPSKTYKKYCSFKNTKGFSSILKSLNLNEWVYQCPNK